VKTIELTDASKSLAEYALEALAEPVTVTHEGRPLVVLYSAVGADKESIALSTNKRFLEIIDESRRSYREKGGIPAAEIRRRLEELDRTEADSDAVVPSETK
jgi:PHD/YefM family antitoxin component YafN of YafNO toxin-antitoxin module